MTLSEARRDVPSGSGVYAIIHRDTKSIYVGHATYVELRADDHFSTLRSGKHHNSRLMRSWIQYGDQGHEFVVLEAYDSKSDARFLEQKWMDDLASNGWTLMNLIRVKYAGPVKQYSKFDADRPCSLQARIPLLLGRRLRIEAARRGLRVRDLLIPAIERELSGLNKL